jgi:hypothetical protein
MASKTRGPDAAVGSTEASKTNFPVQSKPNDSQATRRTQRKKPRKAAKSHVRARRAYTVYDGRLWLGTLVWNERTRLALAWNASRRFVGRFGSIKDAARAIGQAAGAERRAAEARRRLGDPHPPFVTGLPSHFLRRG